MNKEVEGSVLHVVADAGHMIHHTSPNEVAEVTEEMARAVLDPRIGGHSSGQPVNPATVPQDQQPARAVE